MFMTLIDLFLVLLVAAVIGALGKAIAGYSPGGLLVSIGVGFVGAFAGSWIARSFHLPELFVLRVGGTSFPVIWSIIGAALFVGLISLIAGRRRRYVEVP